MLKSFYPSKAIKTIDELAVILDVNVKKLLKVALQSEWHYIENPLIKPNGTIRMTYIVKMPLSSIQAKIKERILNRVRYADYLFCGLKGRKGAVDNAEYHCRNGNPKALLTFDIQNFFPSITPLQVQTLWKEFFNFSEPVAELLTKLTTCFNQLPQGTTTSNHLSNLIFWEKEPILIAGLRKLGVIYSRHGDDMALSLHNNYSKELPNKIISMIIVFLKQYGFNQNRSKFKFVTQGSPMIINKTICINNGALSISKEKRRRARAKVHLYQKAYVGNLNTQVLEKQRQSVLGFLNHCNGCSGTKNA